MASPPMSDRLLWFAVGIAAFVAGKVIQHAFTDLHSLTAAVPKPSIEKPHVKDDEPIDSIPIPTLRTLSTHPNHQIATAASNLLVQKFASTPKALSDLRSETSHPDPTRRKRAQMMWKFIEEWQDNAVTAAYPSGFEDSVNGDYEEGEEEMEEDFWGSASPSDLRELGAEMLRRRPPGAAGAEEVDERLTSLEEELGLDGRLGEGEYLRLLRRVRAVDATGGGDTIAAAVDRRDGEGEHEGRLENARQLGVGNFVGLEPENEATEELTEGQRRRARREAMVLQVDGEDQQGRRSRGWWGCVN